MDNKPQLKTIECINMLLTDLYIDLRRKVNFWSEITAQTSQARMGYVGQHLVSAVTGYKGGKSGARGKDLIISDTEYAEIKTCSRVDQLGKCKNCKAPVSPYEMRCAYCGSDKIVRKNDSKWLISITAENPSKNALQDSEDILVNINRPKYYYFVLFEFKALGEPDSPIVVTVYRVNPKENGFTLCMLDYFYNIKDNAPFNMWPHMLKFNLCNPQIIYRSEITIDDKINTIYFNNENPFVEPFNNLKRYAKSDFSKITLHNLCTEFDISDSDNAADVLSDIEENAKVLQIPNSILIHRFANAFYKEKILSAINQLTKQSKEIPSAFKSYIDAL